MDENTLGLLELLKMEANSDADDGGIEANDSNGSDGDARVGVGTGVVVSGRPMKKGPWTPEEDKLLATYVKANGEGNWNQVQKNAGLNRCGKSCRLRWANHLRPELKKGPFDNNEVDLVIRLHKKMGNKWAKMTAYLPGRTDNEIKNFWNTRTKRLSKAGLEIYPEDLLSPTANQDMDCHSPDDSRGKKRTHELMEGNAPELEDIHFENLDYNKHSEIICFPGNFCTILPPSDVMNPLKRRSSSGNIVSKYNVSLTPEQFQADPERTGYSTDFSYGITQDHSVPFCSATIASGPPISDGNFSCSGTIQRPSNMELPSFQCTPSMDYNSNDFNCSSASPILQADHTNTCSTVSLGLRQEYYTQQTAGLLDSRLQTDGLLDSPLQTDDLLDLPVQTDGLLDSVLQTNHGLCGSTKSQGLIQDLVPPVSHAHPLSPSPPGTDQSGPPCADTFFPSTCHTDMVFHNNHISSCHATSLEANCLNKDSTHSNDQSSNNLPSKATLGYPQEDPMLTPASDQFPPYDFYWDSMPALEDRFPI